MNLCEKQDLTEEEIGMYKKDALSVVNFKLVYEDEKWSNIEGFHPEMAHQAFGENESIFGYRTLKIDIYFLHNSFQCYVDIKSAGMLKNKLYQPDDIEKLLDPWLPSNYTKTESDFAKMAKNERHDTLFGEVLYEEHLKRNIFGKNCPATYKITLCDTRDEKFKEFHERFETLIIWFIDAANFIDLDDEKWMIFYMYEEVEHPESHEIYRTPIGFCTVYKFFAYPNNIRTRISQFFVLPTHQRRGFGSKMYETVFNKLRATPEVVDITVEEPTNLFQKIRDYNDCLLVIKNVKESQPIKIITKTLKICKKQTQRVQDIIDSYYAKKSSLKEYSNVIDRIKGRLAARIERESRGSKRLCNANHAITPEMDANRKQAIEVEVKRYIDDIEPSVRYLESHFQCV